MPTNWNKNNINNITHLFKIKIKKMKRITTTNGNFVYLICNFKK